MNCASGRDARQASLREVLHKQVYVAVEKRGDKLYARVVVIRLLQPGDDASDCNCADSQRSARQRSK